MEIFQTFGHDPNKPKTAHMKKSGADSIPKLPAYHSTRDRFSSVKCIGIQTRKYTEP